MVTATRNQFQALAREIHAKMPGAGPWLRLQGNCAMAVHMGQLDNPRSALCGQRLAKLTTDTPWGGDWLCANCARALARAGITVPQGLLK